MKTSVITLPCSRVQHILYWIKEGLWPWSPVYIFFDHCTVLVSIANVCLHHYVCLQKITDTLWAKLRKCRILVQLNTYHIFYGFPVHVHAGLGLRSSRILWLSNSATSACLGQSLHHDCQLAAAQKPIWDWAVNQWKVSSPLPSSNRGLWLAGRQLLEVVK